MADYDDMDEFNEEAVGHDININFGRRGEYYPTRGWSAGDDYPYPYEQHTHLHKSNVYNNYDDDNRSYSGAKVESELPNDHLKKADVAKHVQKITFVARLKGSYADLASNPKKAVWKPSAEEIKTMLTNTRLVNRANAIDSELTGDLARVILVDMEPLEYKNGCDKDIDVHITDIAPRTLTGSGKAAMTLEANHTSTAKIGSIFAADKIFTMNMGRNMESHNIKEVDTEIRALARQPGFVSIPRDGVVWERIATQFERWPDLYDSLYDENELGKEYLTVNQKVAQDVRDDIVKETSRNKAHFTDMNKFEVTFSPGNGELWDTVPSNVNGSYVVPSNSLNKPRASFVRLQCLYVIV